MQMFFSLSEKRFLSRGLLRIQGKFVGICVKCVYFTYNHRRFPRMSVFITLKAVCDYVGDVVLSDAG